MNININGSAVSLPDEQGHITYEETVSLANKTGYPTVTYRGPRNGDSQRSGEMHTGCAPVKLEDNMIFSVIHTGNA